MKVFLLAITGALLPFLSVAQKSNSRDRFVKKVEENSATFSTDFTSERVYVHTDKALYVPGETLWYVGYLREETLMLPSEKSDILNVEILNPQGTVIEKQRLRIKDGKAPGDFNFHPSLPGGIYTIKAYSNWQLNDTNTLVFEKKVQLQELVVPNLLFKLEFKEKGFGPGDSVRAHFEVRDVNDQPLRHHTIKYTTLLQGKEAVIGNAITDDKGKSVIRFKLPDDLNTGDGLLNVQVEYRGKSESVARSVPITLRKLQMEFYPEGGDLVEGMQFSVGFVCLNEFGKPVDIEGRVVDGNGKTITSLKSLHQGMGAFELKPGDGKYYVEVSKPADISQKFELPEPMREGYVFSVADRTKDSLTLTLQSNRDTHGYVVLAVRNTTYLVKRVKMIPGLNKYTLPISQVPVGVARLTFFDAKNVERAERLVFVNKHRQLKIKVETDKKIYAPREEVTVKVSVQDETGMPMPGNFSVAVVSDKLLTYADDKSGNILAKLLLEPELKGKVEEPNFYFDKKEEKADQALDLLMMTRGWRRFSWKQLLAGKLEEKPFSAEKAEVGGVLISGYSGMPVKNRKISIKGTDRFVTTDKKRGIFLFSDVDLTESITLVFGSGVRGELHVSSYDNDLIVYTPSRPSGSYSITDRSQSGNSSVRGVVSDAESKESVPFANVVLYQNGVQVGGATTDFDGNFRITDVPAGECSLRVSFVGYEAMEVPGIYLSQNQTISLEISLQQGVTLNAIEMVEYSVPLIDSDNTSTGATIRRDDIRRRPEPRSGTTVSREEIKKMPGRSAESVTVGGVWSQDGERGSVRGSRADAVDTYIDGIKVRGSLNLPQSRIDRNDILLTGTPASSATRFDGYSYSRSRGRYVYESYGGEQTFYSYRGKKEGLYRAREFPLIVYSPTDTVEVRNDYRSTIYWNPVITTPANGKGSFKFFNGDDITTYRIVMEGLSVDGEAGRTEQTYSVQQPYSVDFKIPPSTRVGDTVLLSLNIQNNQDSVLNLKLTSFLPQFWKLLDNKDNTVSIQPKGFLNHNLKFLVTASGADTFGIAYENGVLTERRVVPVVSYPRGFPHLVSINSEEETDQTFDVDVQDVMDESLRANLIVYPNALSDMLQGVEAMLREPHGCFEQVSSTTYPNILALQYLELNGLDNDEVADRAYQLIANGYNKLAAYEASTGGFDWYGKAPGNEALTAFGIMEFTDMAKVWPGVSPELIKRSTKWLLDKRDGKGGFNYHAPGRYGYGFADTDVTNAYVVWALTEAGVEGLDKELAYVQKQSLKNKDPYQLALAALSAFNYSELSLAKEALDALGELQKQDGSWVGRLHSITRSTGRSLLVETTSLAVMAYLRSAKKERIALDNAMHFIISQRTGRGYFGSSQATILAIKAINEYATYMKTLSKGGNIRLVVNDIEVAETEFSGNETQAIVFRGFEENLKTGKNKIRVVFENSDKPLPFTANFGWSRSIPATSPDAKVKMEVDMSNSSATIGETNRLTATITNVTKEALPNTLAVIGIPAGLSLQPWQLKELQEKEVFDYYEIAGNKLFLYFRGMAPQEKINVGFDLKADIRGTYSPEPSCAYLYYTSEDKFWVKGEDVIVK